MILLPCAISACPIHCASPILSTQDCHSQISFNTILVTLSLHESCIDSPPNLFATCASSIYLSLVLTMKHHIFKCDCYAFHNTHSLQSSGYSHSSQLISSLLHPIYFCINLDSISFPIFEQSKASIKNSASISALYAPLHRQSTPLLAIQILTLFPASPTSPPFDIMRNENCFHCADLQADKRSVKYYGR